MENIKFASDNYAPAHKDVLKKIMECNFSNEISYGNDIYTSELREIFKENLGRNVEIFPVFNGTGANVLALGSVLKRYQGVISSSFSHLHTDEGGSPEGVGNFKNYVITSEDGKLNVELIKNEYFGIDDVHRAEPKAVSIANTTERGLIYSTDEINEIGKFCKENHLIFHIDGARIFNAASGLNLGLFEMLREYNCDLLSLGGSKVGAMMAELVVVFNPTLKDDVARLQKTFMQLPSKMRYISSQMLALIEGDLGVNLAHNANNRMSELISYINFNSEIYPYHKPSANALFLKCNKEFIEELSKKYRFYIWDEGKSVIRLMTNWSTNSEEIVELSSDINNIINNIDNN